MMPFLSRKRSQDKSLTSGKRGQVGECDDRPTTNSSPSDMVGWSHIACFPLTSGVPADQTTVKPITLEHTPDFESYFDSDTTPVPEELWNSDPPPNLPGPEDYESDSGSEANPPSPLIGYYTLTELVAEGESRLDDAAFVRRLKSHTKPTKYCEKATFSLEELEQQFNTSRKKWFESDHQPKIRHILENLVGVGVCQQIDQSICLALGSFSVSRYQYPPRSSLDQFVAWKSIVNTLKGITGKPIRMIAQDPEFNRVDKAFLAKHHVDVVDHPAGFHMINKSTFLMSICLPYASAFAEMRRSIAPLHLHNRAEFYTSDYPSHRFLAEPRLQAALDKLGMEDHPEHLRRLKGDIHFRRDWVEFLDRHDVADYPVDAVLRHPGCWGSRSQFGSLRFYWDKREDDSEMDLGWEQEGDNGDAGVDWGDDEEVDAEV